MDSTLWSRTPLEPRPSRFDTGAFAAEDLDQGTIVIPKWHESFYEGMEGWVRLGKQQVKHLPREARQLFLRYGLDQDFDQIIGNFDEPYECCCGAAQCRGRIRRQDWKKLAITYGMNMPRFLHERIERITRSLNNDRKDRRYHRNSATGLVGEHKPSAA
jgi:hypothetical protein